MWDRNDLQKEMETAVALFDTFGAEILADRRLGALLAAYRELIEESDELMRLRGVPAVCTKCASETGSCCFEGIAYSGYDSVLLLINLLFGHPLASVPQVAGACHFLGERGCTLIARYSFCLNYLCPLLKLMLGESGRDELQRKIGEQLAMGWETEQALRKWLAARAAQR
jgi:hypothetical protein